MAFESGDFKYAIHHFPGPVPGQGTRNMQSAAYNLKYAQSIPALAGLLPAAKAAGGNAVVNMLVQYSNIDFGSAAWLLTSQCEPGVVSGLAAGTPAAFAAYVKCYGGTLSDELKAYYTRGLAALGGKASG
jgi:hypothetical protein